MFTYKPELAQDDDDEAEYTIERDVEEDEDNVSVHDVKEEVIDIGEVCTFYSISVFVSHSFFLSLILVYLSIFLARAIQPFKDILLITLF